MATARRAASVATRMVRLGAIAAVALVIAAADATAGEGALVRRGGFRTLELLGAEAREGVALPDVFVVEGTDTVLVDGSRLCGGADYVIDHDRSLLSFLTALGDSAEVVVSYRFLPLALESRVYRHAVLDTLAARYPVAGGGAELVDTRAPSAESPASGLRVAGAKTFGITVGSDRDPSLEQSLRLNMSGRLTRDVAVRAYLSDQNTPLVPEGDTEELRALDRVLVEIEGDGVSATMGDYELAVEGGSLGAFRRDLTGAMVSAQVGPADIVLAGARSSGEFHTHTFRGIDGLQGPYRLVDRSGSPGVQVVAGTERVWLDGERLTRGRDNHYVIDYALGEIEFTERVPLSSDREITVDYEYALSDYERDIYGGRASAATADGRASVGVSFLREADDRDASASTVLTDDVIAVLAAAGDRQELAHDDGVDSVGFGNGDYVFVAAGVYEYAGADSGDYELSFERYDEGDYAYDFEVGHYVYAGPGEGDYRLGRSLPLPSESNLVAADARLETSGGGFVSIEAAVSSRDANTFSSLDDDDNLGNAEVVSAGLPSLEFGALGGGGLGVGVRARRVGGSFEGVGRYRDVRYTEKWELSGLELPGEELMVEGSARASLDGGGRLELSHGYLARGEVLESRKTELAFETTPWQGARAWAEARRVDVDHESAGRRERLLYVAGAEQLLGVVRPGLLYRRDSRETAPSEGERYDEYAASMSSAGRGDLSFSARYAHRFTERGDGSRWTRASVTRIQDYRVGLAGREALSLEATLTRRVTVYEEGLADADTKYDVAALRANHRSLGGALTGELHYAVSSTQVEERERYVTEKDGVEIIRTVSTGVFYPVTDLTASTRWKLDLRQSAVGPRGLPHPSATMRFLSALSLETDVKLSERTTTDERRRLYLLDPAILRGDDTVRGELATRHVARYTPGGGRYSARVAVSTRDALDRSYTNASERRRERNGVVDVKLSPTSRTTLVVRGDLARREQDALGAGDSYDVSERAARVELARRGVGDLEAKLLLSLTREEEALEGIELTALEVTPSVTYRIRGKGTATASLTRIEIDTAAEALPLYLAGGRRPGVTSEWRISGDLRLNRYLTGSLTYTGERRFGNDTRHTIDVRVNAFF